MIDEKVLIGLRNIRQVPTSLKQIVRIGNVPKPVLGAVLLEIKVNGNILLLKCHVIDDRNYSVVLGRDMINCQVAGIDNIRNMILFRKGVTEEVESDLNRAADCFLTRDTMLQPNSVTQLDFETRLDSEGGEIMGAKDQEKNGVKV